MAKSKTIRFFFKKNPVIVLCITFIVVLIYATLSSFSGKSIQFSILSLLIALYLFIFATAPWIDDKINEIIKTISDGSVKAYLEDKKLYLACAYILSDEPPSIIRHALLHAHDGKARDYNDVDTKSFHKAFDEALKNCINSSGTGSWKVQTLILVTSLNRLNNIEKFIKEKFNEGKNFEVKIYITPKALPYLSPLIIGEEHAFLALDDKSEYRVQDGFHLIGKDSVKLLIEYFDSLWNSKDAIEIRSAIELDEIKLDEIKNNFTEYLKA